MGSSFCPSAESPKQNHIWKGKGTILENTLLDLNRLDQMKMKTHRKNRRRDDKDEKPDEGEDENLNPFS